jgi:diadenosine tetraphosphate (Ap4A) HIT family hydrolase
MTGSCSLCADLIAGDVVYQDDDCRVVLHEDWAVRGHAMVVARRHVENVSDLPPDEWRRIAEVLRRTERGLLDLVPAERAILMKLGVATPHLHLHIYPVSNTLDRESVVRILDGRTGEPRDERFVETLRLALALAV